MSVIFEEVFPGPCCFASFWRHKRKAVWQDKKKDCLSEVNQPFDRSSAKATAYAEAQELVIRNQQPSLRAHRTKRDNRQSVINN